MNAKESKNDKKIECWNCGGNYFARDCTKPAKKEGDKKGKVNVTFTDYDDEDIMVMELYLPVSKIIVQNIFRMMMIMKI